MCFKLFFVNILNRLVKKKPGELYRFFHYKIAADTVYLIIKFIKILLYKKYKYKMNLAHWVFMTKTSQSKKNHFHTSRSYRILYHSWCEIKLSQIINLLFEIVIIFIYDSNIYFTFIGELLWEGIILSKSSLLCTRPYCSMGPFLSSTQCQIIFRKTMFFYLFFLNRKMWFHSNESDSPFVQIYLTHAQINTQNV